jgi:hypothetical protein
MRFNEPRKLLLGALVATGLIAVAACGGANPGVQYPSPIGVTSTSIPSGSSATLTMPQTSGLAVGTATVTGSGSVTATQSASNPSPVPAVQLKARSASTMSATTASTSATDAVDYITLTATTAATVSRFSASVSPTSTIPAGTYYLAYWNGSQWLTVGSAASISGGIISVNSGSFSTPITLASGTSLYFVVYTGQIFTTPTPEPSAPIALPSTITLAESEQGTITVTSGGNIQITAAVTASSATNLVTVSPSSSTTSSGVTGTATFTITASPSETGTATVTFTDPLGHTAQTAVTVVANTPPGSTPTAAVISIGDIAAIQLTSKANTAITVAVSPSPSSIAALNTTDSSSGTSGLITVTTDSSGKATFYVVAQAGGTTTITMTDPYDDVGTLPITVSAIANGGFTNGLTSWAPCSYTHTALAAPVSPASPVPNSPVPAQTAASETPVPLASLSPLVAVTAPPANDNPGYPNAGTVSANGVAYVSPTTAPAALGSYAAFVGTVAASPNPYPKGTFGICQTFTVPATTPYLSFWIFEGGSEYSFKYGDEEAAIFPSYSSNVASGTPSYLFAEANCYLHPTIASPPGIWGGTGTDTDSGCWPQAYGGDTDNYYDWVQGGYWSERGPYDLSSYAGQTITLFVGNWSYYNDTAAYYAQFVYVGSVQLGATNTFPVNSVYEKGRTLTTVQLKPRAAATVQTTKRQ